MHRRTEETLQDRKLGHILGDCSVARVLSHGDADHRIHLVGDLRKPPGRQVVVGASLLFCRGVVLPLRPQQKGRRAGELYLVDEPKGLRLFTLAHEKLGPDHIVSLFSYAAIQPKLRCSLQRLADRRHVPRLVGCVH